MTHECYLEGNKAFSSDFSMNNVGALNVGDDFIISESEGMSYVSTCLDR